MKQTPFEANHRPAWVAFERFLDRSGAKAGALHGFAPAEMPARYRRLCQNLALAVDRQYSPELVDALNRLVLRGYHLLYANRGRQSQRVIEFFLSGFPSLVRSEWRLVSIAALLFFGPLLLLIAVLQTYPEFVHYLLGPREIADFHEMYQPSSRSLGMREADSNVLMFGYYIWNNVRIGFQTLAGGILAGIGTVWFLVSNGVVIGAAAGYVTQVGHGQQFWSFVSGHSALELTAIVLSGAAGMRLGLAVISPGRLSRKRALVLAAKPAVMMMYGAAAMFTAAAFVEAFWSPLTLPFGVKIAAGLAAWAAVFAWLALAGRIRAAV